MSRPRPLTALLTLGAALAGGACQTTGEGRSSGALAPPPLLLHEALEAGIDVEHYALDLALVPEARAIEGSCTLRLHTRGGTQSQVELQLAGLTVRGVSDVEGRTLPHRQEGESLFIELAEPLTAGGFQELTIEYGGQPRKGLWFVGDDGMGNPTHCFTQGEPEDAHWWFPCIDRPDDRATSEIRVELPAHWIAVAAGDRIDRVDGTGMAVEHWRMSTPHPPYLLTLVAGDLAIVEDEWQGVPLSYLAPREHAELLSANFAETGAMLSFFSELTGVRYPYSKYAQACVDEFPFGGMENISATTLTTSALDDVRGARDGDIVGLLAHEAAHQWFGDLLTCADWSEIWLNEGFATYLTLLYYEHTRGEEAFRERLYDTTQSYLSAVREEPLRTTTSGVYREPIDLFDGHVYQGGALRLHQLRSLLGDTAFFDVIAVYCAENVGRSVTSADLLAAAERVTGEELDWFFEQWLETAGVPQVHVQWGWDRSDREVDLRVIQRQVVFGRAPFRAPVDVELRTSRGTTLHRIEMTSERETFHLPADERPMWVRFDEGGWLPMVLESEKAPAEWLAIANQGDDVIGRRRAVAALIELVLANDDSKELCITELANRLDRDSSAAVRREAAVGLGMTRGGLEARRWLEAAASGDDSASVRVAALDGLRSWGVDEGLARFARAQWEASYSWKTTAAAIGLLCTSAPASGIALLSEELGRDSHNDQLSVALMSVLGEFGGPTAGVELARLAADPSLHPDARIAALEVLSEQDVSDDTARALYAGLLDQDHFKLRLAALEALSELGGLASERALREHYDATPFARERRAIEAAFRLPAERR